MAFFKRKWSAPKVEFPKAVKPVDLYNVTLNGNTVKVHSDGNLEAEKRYLNYEEAGKIYTRLNVHNDVMRFIKMHG